MLKRFKAAAGPSLDPGYGRDSDMEVISIPAVIDTGEEFCSTCSFISDISKFRDPLHLLSDYIAEIGTCSWCLVLEAHSRSNPNANYTAST